MSHIECITIDTWCVRTSGEKLVWKMSHTIYHSVLVLLVTLNEMSPSFHPLSFALFALNLVP